MIYLEIFLSNFFKLIFIFINCFYIRQIFFIFIFIAFITQKIKSVFLFSVFNIAQQCPVFLLIKINYFINIFRSEFKFFKFIIDFIYAPSIFKVKFNHKSYLIAAIPFKTLNWISFKFRRHQFRFLKKYLIKILSVQKK